MVYQILSCFPNIKPFIANQTLTLIATQQLIKKISMKLCGTLFKCVFCSLLCEDVRSNVNKTTLFCQSSQSECHIQSNSVQTIEISSL